MIDSRIARERVLEFLKGNPIPALAGMEEAVVSHWIQNPDDSVYAGFRDIFAGAVIAGAKKRKSSVAAESGYQDLLFKIDVPFPPPEKPRFTFIDLFYATGKSRTGQHFINRRFQPTIAQHTPSSPAGTALCLTLSTEVSSLRDLEECLPCRRLKPTVNKVLSLRDRTHDSRKRSRFVGEKRGVV